MQDGTATLKAEVYELEARARELDKSDDPGVAEVSGWYENLITRMREHIAEREALTLGKTWSKSDDLLFRVACLSPEEAKELYVRLKQV